MDFCRGLKSWFLDLDLQPGGERLDERKRKRSEKRGGDRRGVKEEKSNQRKEQIHVRIGMGKDVWMRR